jgi:hypothetical protein
LPQHRWLLTFDEIGGITNAWPRPEDGSLLVWAVWAADGLHRLLDLDDRAFGVWPRELDGYPEAAVDLAHVRWASASAITALDLCAATLGRRRCAPRQDEYSLRDFDPRRGDRKVARSLLAQLESAESAWVKAATRDKDYATVLDTRNPMMHGRVRRVVYGSTRRQLGPHEIRTGFPVGPGGAIVDSRPLIELCATVATGLLEAFLKMVKEQSTLI